MNHHLIECDEYTLLHSFHHESLPEFFPFQTRHVHGTMIFLVHSRIAGVAVVESEGNKVRFSHIYQPENRLALNGAIRTLLVNEWGVNIEEKMRTQPELSEETAKKIIHKLNETPSDFGFYLTNIEHILEEAQIRWKQQQKKEQKEKTKMKFEGLVQQPSVQVPTTDHSKAQFYLKELAAITNCSVWTANNDKNRLYKGERLGEDDLEVFPNFDMDEEVKKRIELIDTIWFNGNIPLNCYEVETSTSIYSGLLRMSDLVAVMPNSNIKLYIVAPNERRKKVLNEMNRPVFRAIGLPSIARFISIESLEILYQKLKGLNGYISPHVVEAISLSIEEMESLESF